MLHLSSLRRPLLDLRLPQMDLGRIGRRALRLLGGLLPGATLALPLVIGVLAVRQHAELTATVQAAEMNRLVSQFRAGPVADAWQALHHAWQNEARRQTTLLSRLAKLSGEPYAATLHDYRHYVIETVDDHHLARPVQVTFGFFKRLAVCVRVGSCPREQVGTTFGDAVWQFRNQHYYYFESELSLAELDQVTRLIAPQAAPTRAKAETIAMP